ncbi:Signal transducing adapter molecule 1 [Papilio machaon]|uniref:Signal transducing adapter molecule 1 n=1 Tax=Papilio machaon TaxID=76193 RepID=A0A0N0PDQ7_PAPMA|nr:Signal transducing adapter molecule 1 [Papilio machaon]
MSQSQEEINFNKSKLEHELRSMRLLVRCASDIVHVTDCSDPNWWKGHNERGEGLFPANFVTSDLSEPRPGESHPPPLATTHHHTPPHAATRPHPPPPHLNISSKLRIAEEDRRAGGKSVQFASGEEESGAGAGAGEEEPCIDEAAMDAALALLHDADPAAAEDERELRRLEARVHAMGPLVDAALERADRRHARLTQLSADLVDALNLYHSLMRDPPKSMYAPSAFLPPGALPPGALPPGALPPGALPPGAMPPGALPPGALPPGALPPGALPPGALPHAPPLAPHQPHQPPPPR